LHLAGLSAFLQVAISIGCKRYKAIENIDIEPNCLQILNISTLFGGCSNRSLSPQFLLMYPAIKLSLAMCNSKRFPKSLKGNLNKSKRESQQQQKKASTVYEDYFSYAKKY